MNSSSKRRTNITLIALVAIAVGGCATPEAPKADTPDPFEVKLSAYAESASRSLRMLAQSELDTEARSRDVRSSQTLSGQMATIDTIPAALDRTAAITWTGPAEDLAKKIALEAGYQFTVSGRRPILPVVASVATTNATLYDVLLDVGHQIGKSATLVVRPNAREIEIRYGVTK